MATSSKISKSHWMHLISLDFHKLICNVDVKANTSHTSMALTVLLGKAFANKNDLYAKIPQLSLVSLMVEQEWLFPHFMLTHAFELELE